MLELFYPGRPMVLDSPLAVEELTRRLQILPRSGGARLNVRLRLHPVVGRSPFLTGVLAMAGVAFVFALLANIEARTSTRLLHRGGNEAIQMNSQRYLVLALMLSFTAATQDSRASSSLDAALAIAADQTAASDKCPLRAADLDKLTPYRWQVAQYQADRGFIPSNGAVRIDYCELIGKDDKGQMRTGVMVNIARGAHADAFAKHWHAVCASSLMPDARGKVQPVAGVPGAQQCVTAKGSSSVYWIELPGRTIQIEPETDDVAWAKIFPQMLAAVAR